jgi:hypothetical protein
MLRKSVYENMYTDDEYFNKNDNIMKTTSSYIT